MITTRLTRFSELVEGDLHSAIPVSAWKNDYKSWPVYIRGTEPFPPWMVTEWTYKVTIGTVYGPPLSGWQPPQPAKER